RSGTFKRRTRDNNNGTAMSEFIVNDATRPHPAARTTARRISSPPLQTTKFISLTVTQTSSFRSDATSILLMNYFIGSNDNHLTSSLNGRRYQSVSHTQGNAI